MDNIETLNVGIVGYSATQFNIGEAELILMELFLSAKKNSGIPVNIVSGLTNIGVPKIAYGIAKTYGFYTTGIACSKAFDYECFPVDTKIIVGDNWGDESETFLNYIDILVRVGGGKQSLAEVALAKEKNIPVIEYDLDGE
jgi:hypothetical protein